MTRLARLETTLAPSAPAVVATVYVSTGCDCCRKALDVLEKARDRDPRLVIETIDIASDPELAEAFQNLTPVVAINDKIRFRGLVNPVLLDRLLAAEGT